MHSHNPVPFDFVPFEAQAPEVRTVEDWEREGMLFSGRIDYTVTALTPVHIVGKQTSSRTSGQRQITRSGFYRSGGVPVISGASIKGMVRAFFEALTNSWVSQATDVHPVAKNRHFEFAAYSSPPPNDPSQTRAIPIKFHPKIEGKKIDLASFLFGTVIEAGENTEALRSRFIFEDIRINPQVLDDDIIRLPDVPGNAFMGGAKPRKNNWWYFRPHSIRKRYEPRAGIWITDFIGGEYWGRKFYYHQNPEQALSWYDNKKNWPHTKPKRINRVRHWVENYYTYPVEVIPVDAGLEGTVYFDRVPAPFIELFKFAFQPGNDIKHKIGYGKAFGLGSIDIQVVQVDTVPAEEYIMDVNQVSINSVEMDVSQYIFQNSLGWLKRILKYDEMISDTDWLFTYPLYFEDPSIAPQEQGIFMVVIPWNNYFIIPDDTPEVTPDEARKIAQAIYLRTRKPVHFRFYQEESSLWEKIEKRVQL